MKIIFNPFVKYPEKALLALGLLFVIAGSFMGYFFNARYDGVLDTHFVPFMAPVQPFIDIVINTVSLFIVFFAFGKIINPKTRPIDILNVSLIAPGPYYLLPLFNIGNLIMNSTLSLERAMGTDINTKPSPDIFKQISTTEIVSILVFALIGLAFLVWFVVLLYNGFKTATNLKTTGHKVLFAFGILLAEVLSKIILYFLPY